jgi:hypothetical protein
MKFEKKVSILIGATPAEVRDVILGFSSYPDWNHFWVRAEVKGDYSLVLTTGKGTAIHCKVVKNDSTWFKLQGKSTDYYSYRFEDFENQCRLHYTITSDCSLLQKIVGSIFGLVLTTGMKMHLAEIASRCERGR